jgi:hypothetical protein
MNPEDVVMLFEDVHDFFSKKSGRNSVASTLLTLRVAQYPDTEELRDMVVSATKFVTKKSSESELFFCSEDMTDVVEHAAKLFDSTDKADLSLLPSPVGFCYFARGVVLGNDGPSGLQGYITHALYWVRASDDLYFLVSLNDSYVEQDTQSKSQRSQLLEGTTYFDTQQRWTVNYVASVVSDSAIARNSTDILTSEELSKNNFKFLDLSPQALAQSFYLMVDQHTFVDKSEKVKTSHKKRVKRLQSKNLPTSTQVIKLRRTYHSSGSAPSHGKKIEYSHRWFVTGHWRWQPYKNKETKEIEHKRLWISPYVKGPEDMPLKTTPKVFSLVR